MEIDKVINRKTKFLSFEDARKFAHTLNIKGKDDWAIYSKSANKPKNIPSYPYNTYKDKGWISWGDWLGKNKDFKGEFLSFEEARKFVHILNIKNVSDWKNYSKSGNKPKNIPSSPSVAYKNKGWTTWGGFLGADIVALQLKKKCYLPFEDAKIFVNSLKLKSQTEWIEYYKCGLKPENIPACPQLTYKNNGWKSWGDWLGKNKNFRGGFLSFEEARKFVHTLNLKSRKDWKNYCNSGKKPKNIPAEPLGVYKKKGWISNMDWLGTKRINNKDRYFLSFEDAKNIVLLLRIKGKAEWFEYTKSEEFSENMPVNPVKVYKDNGWVSWGDWLGKNKDFKGEFLSFEDARIFVTSLELKNTDEWKEYCKFGNKPSNIPVAPWSTYKNKGWISWADFLGYLGNGEHRWYKHNIIAYLQQIKSYLHICSIPQLMTIIESNGLFNYITKEKLKKLQDTRPDSEERIQLTEELIKDITNIEEDELVENDEIHTGLEEIEFADDEYNGETTDDEDKTEIKIKTLKALDNSTITASLDDERVQFIVRDTINGLWYDVLNHKLDTDRIKSLEFETELPGRIKDDFITEYEEVIKLQLPPNWTYKFQPLLMQKLISYRLSQHRQYGNWSGVGSGKTVGAILAGRYVGAKNTLIITFNSTIGKEDERGWTKEIRDSFKDSKIYTKINKNIKFDDKYYNYLILNYETFQQKGSANYVIDLLEKNKFDYIILDEVQSVKQRNTANESKRREVIFGLVGKVRELNPDYYLLAMSATPVINNLVEAKSLIELIGFTKLDDVNTNPNISNCIELFRRLTNCGIRHKNIEDDILKDKKYTIVDVDASEFYKEASFLSYDDVLVKEQLMLEPKLKAILPYINSSKGKTVIYTHYVGGLEDVIYDYLVNLGYKVGMYTGSYSKYNRDSALSEFIKGEYDILLGSRPMSTGVDGLQFVADRLIILSLPWTNAELIQLVGRINRKGSNFIETGVDVIIPLVSIGDSIKWDEHKYNTVTYKATIANAVVDGIIPDKILVPRKRLLEKASDNLDEWIDRLEHGDILTVNREELKVGLYPDITDEEERRRKINSELSEFNRLGKIAKSSTMNKKFNDDPDSWYYYHDLRREAMKDWDEIPYKVIAKNILCDTDEVIDFGCGDNQFKLEIPNNKVTSIDHIAIDESVIACDMSDLSKHIGDETHDAAVFSLSLWGTNYKDYIKEAYRVLRRKGFIYIAEPSKHYETIEEQDELKQLISEAGFKIVGNIDMRDKFIYITGIKI